MNKQLRLAHWMFLTAAILAIFAGCAQNTPDAVFNRGMKAYQENDLIAASIYFDDFITKFPDNERSWDAYNLLALCYYRMRDFGSARGVYEELQNKGSLPANMVLECSQAIGRLYAEEGNLEKAQAVFEDVIEKATGPEPKINSYWMLASMYGKQKQAEKAHEYLETILKVADSDLEDVTTKVTTKLQALEASADIYKASDEFSKARDEYARSLDVAKSATGVVWATDARQNAVINWANTYVSAGDYVSAATIYDHLQNNPYIQDAVKPQLIVYKIQSLERLFSGDDGKYTPEETAVLVHEHHRMIDNYDNTDYGTNARVEIASLIKDTTPDEAKKLLDEAIARYEKVIAEPPSPDKPVLAMFQIANAYIKMEMWDQAEQALERIKLTYSDVPEAMKQAQAMVDYIQKQKAAAAETAAPLPDEAGGDAATGAEQGG
ncbi:MAG: tetratricopeptide repeat protein [bacterium]|nr:tetratricopeptide repeat protein [bacterium]